ncbi:MAG: DUF2520 domain-containing protein [Candidatus Nealsonbacteria bacterium]|nr:DUF2520 domain-containing protein [Candidatus Nealsonbacteria bacterium]
MKTLDIIGCGKLGSTLAKLWTDLELVQVRSILNRSTQSGRRAAEFVGAGRPIDDYAQLEPADVMMIASPDEAVEQCCLELCRTEVLADGVTLFHCSGSLPSTLLKPARQRGAVIASLHPVKSFADPAAAVATFSGTFCAVEGEPAACDVIRELLKPCGAIPFQVESQFKTIYHAATVIVCNYLVALMEVGLKCFEKAGIPRATAEKIIEPIVRGTVDNVFRLGPVEALTGPIARGEVSVVEAEVADLSAWNDLIGRIYSELGHVAVDLSAAQGTASADALAAIEDALRKSR